MSAEDDQAAPESPEAEDDPDDDYLADIGDGFGCVEIWEHLSDAREND